LRFDFCIFKIKNMHIYKATNKENGKFYIGQTKDLKSRKQTHAQSVFAKANPDIIEWEIIDSAQSREELNKLERHYIDKLKPHYNTQCGGSYNEGVLRDIILKTPQDFCYTPSFFNRKNISRTLVRNYVNNGWLRKIEKGLYCKRFNDPNIVYACINEGDFHIGGLSAIEKHGASHYIRFDDKCYIYTNKKRLKKWVKSENFNLDIKKIHHNVFNTGFGIKDGVSCLERAIIEMIHIAPSVHTVQECEYIMDGLSTLRPNYLQKLLEGCKNIGTKRVFLYLARKSGWKWYDKIDQSKIDLGNGKRSIIKGGKLDNEFDIVI